MAEFLGRIIAAEPAQAEERASDELARAMLVRLILHRSKLNVVDVMRELSGAWTAQGDPIESSQALASNFGNRLVVSVQLAVETILDFPFVVEILRRRPLLQQLATDAAYRFSRSWEKGPEVFATSEAGFVAYLAQRLGLDLEPSEDPISPVRARLGRAPLQDLQNIADVTFLLGDFELLRKFAEKHLPQQDKVVLDAIPSGLGRGILKESASREVYDILFDIYGRDLKTGQLIAAPGQLDFEFRDKIVDLSSTVEFFGEALEAAGLTAPELVAAGLLPSTISWGAVEDSRRQAFADAVHGGRSNRLSSDLPVLESFVASLRVLGQSLGKIVELVMRLRRALGTALPLQALVPKLARFIDVQGVAAGRRDSCRSAAPRRSTTFPSTTCCSPPPTWRPRRSSGQTLRR